MVLLSNNGSCADELTSIVIVSNPTDVILKNPSRFVISLKPTISSIIKLCRLSKVIVTAVPDFTTSLIVIIGD